jgi:hypothetical protein
MCTEYDYLDRDSHTTTIKYGGVATNVAGPSKVSVKTIENILRSDPGRRYYGDGRPTWTQGESRRPAKTSAKAAHERELLAKALVRSKDATALALAETLRSCEPHRRCVSGACPECGRAAQRLFVEAAQHAMASCRDDLLMVTVVLSTAIIADGDLRGRELFATTRRRLTRVLREVGASAFGGFDISFNEHEHGAFAPHWSPHACFFLLGADMERGEETLRARFPHSREVPRPVFAKAFDGKLNGLAYALKSDFQRRVSLAPQFQSSGQRSRFQTRQKAITKARRVELAVAFAGEGLGARLFLEGWTIAATGAGVTLVRQST